MSGAALLAAGGADAAAAWVLRLSLGPAGAGDAAAPRDWERVFALAVRERCAALAWRRSGPLIRAAAPGPVAAAWRAHAVQVDARGRRLLAAIAEVLAAAGEAAPVVLKGFPLSKRLYGDPFVRSTADVDLLVPLAGRAAIADVLRTAGWRHAHGESPWEEAWERGEGRETLYVDVHSSLLDHNLAHLPAPAVDTETVDVEGVALRSCAGPLLPAFLASHAAKHRLPPLLWFVDLSTLWASLSPEERVGATDAARRHRLARYLAWGLRRAEAVVSAAEGSRDALLTLGVRPEGRRDAHPALRDAWLAASPLDAVRSVAAWTVPPPLRRDPAALAARFAARTRALARLGSPGE